jgi:hypothetical protein
MRDSKRKRRRGVIVSSAQVYDTRGKDSVSRP